MDLKDGARSWLMTYMDFVRAKLKLQRLLSWGNIAAKVFPRSSFERMECPITTVFRIQIISAIVDCLSKLMLSNVCCFFCFASSGWVSVVLFTCLVTLVLVLKKFFTFATASACFFPDAWTVSAERPEKDNSITLWQIVYLALVDFSSLASQSLNDGSESRVSRKYFWFLGSFLSIFYSYFRSN